MPKHCRLSKVQEYWINTHEAFGKIKFAAANSFSDAPDWLRNIELSCDMIYATSVDEFESLIAWCQGCSPTPPFVACLKQIIIANLYLEWQTLGQTNQNLLLKYIGAWLVFEQDEHAAPTNYREGFNTMLSHCPPEQNRQFLIFLQYTDTIRKLILQSILSTYYFLSVYENDYTLPAQFASVKKEAQRLSKNLALASRTKTLLDYIKSEILFRQPRRNEFLVTFPSSLKVIYLSAQKYFLAMVDRFKYEEELLQNVSAHMSIAFAPDPVHTLTLKELREWLKKLANPKKEALYRGRKKKLFDFRVLITLRDTFGLPIMRHGSLKVKELEFSEEKPVIATQPDCSIRFLYYENCENIAVL